jgi:hypothetical protein
LVWSRFGYAVRNYRKRWGFGSCGMWRCVAGWKVCNIRKNVLSSFSSVKCTWPKEWRPDAASKHRAPFTQRYTVTSQKTGKHLFPWSTDRVELHVCPLRVVPHPSTQSILYHFTLTLRHARKLAVG